MRRTILLLTVVALVVAVVAITALPAFADDTSPGGHVGADVSVGGTQLSLNQNLPSVSGLLNQVSGLVGSLGL
jgi:hypothetical protein